MSVANDLTMTLPPRVRIPEPESQRVSRDARLGPRTVARCVATNGASVVYVLDVAGASLSLIRHDPHTQYPFWWTESVTDWANARWSPTLARAAIAAIEKAMEDLAKHGGQLLGESFTARDPRERARLRCEAEARQAIYDTHVAEIAAIKAGAADAEAASGDGESPW